MDMMSDASTRGSTEDFVRGRLGLGAEKRIQKIKIPAGLVDIETVKPGMEVTIRISGRIGSISGKGFDIEADSAEFEGMTGEAETGMESIPGGTPPMGPQGLGAP